ncbi:hypothetical protein ASG73_00970 [Janibacter sp. Soil728]|uniref:GntR family transcriptional regulator n=1 Tax=Janibacter sp. Soil728 TaxID=1736393 RepID=UPI0006F51C67|nr:GntR family transcriptional regulator [Janibacter sp. Soil728]KRE38971.1 hypothetical protein ASG73_00970 [Janibacter sp. Soil728]
MSTRNELRGGSGTASPPTVTEFVTEQIRDRIVLGQLKPDQRLSVYSLAEELGVSRVPLREAVRQLEAESLVVNVPRRGTVISALSGNDIHDAFVMLNRIENLAAERAALNPGDVAQDMRYWLDRMAELVDQGVPAASPDMLHAHRAFHFALFRAAGKEGLLFRHLCMLWNTAERYVINSRTDKRLHAAHCEHTTLTEKIEAGDGAGAIEALETHLNAAWEATKVYLSSQDIEGYPEDLDR